MLILILVWRELLTVTYGNLRQLTVGLTLLTVGLTLGHTFMFNLIIFYFPKDLYLVYITNSIRVRDYISEGLRGSGSTPKPETKVA